MRFSVSSSNKFLIYNNKGMEVMRKQVPVEYFLIQECSPYLSLWHSKFFPETIRNSRTEILQGSNFFNNNSSEKYLDIFTQKHLW